MNTSECGNKNIPTKSCTRKNCSHNGEPLPLSMFPKDSNKRDGLACWCRDCRSESSLEWQREHKDKHKKYNKKYRAANADKIRVKIEKWQNENAGRVRKNQREWKRKNAAKVKAKNKENLASNPERFWVGRAIIRCKNRAKEKAVPFSLTKNDLMPLPEFCCVFGIKLDYLSGPDKRTWASVDRIDPKLGYVSGNVRIISRAANMAKLDGLGDIVALHIPS